MSISWRNRDRSSSRGFTLIELLLCIAIVGILVMLLMPARRTAGPAAWRASCKNNLRQIGQALANYDAEYGALPPAYTVDADGRPLHSWRTLLLPYLGERVLYDQIDLSKPWDDPAHELVAGRRVNSYSCPSAEIPNTHTLYQAVVSTTSWIRVGGSESLGVDVEATNNEDTDDTRRPSATVIVTEVDLPRATHWMQPVDTNEAFFADLDESAETAHRGGVQAVLSDGSVSFLSSGADLAERESLLRRDRHAAEPFE